MKSDKSFFFDRVLPDYGYKLVMKIDTVNSLSYPNHNFKLFQVYIKGFNFDGGFDKPEFANGYAGLRTYYFLVALNIANGDVKFISGDFLLSYIKNDFKIDVKHPESLIPYIQFRSFCIKPNDIVFQKRKRNQLYYTTYSTTNERDVVIIVSVKDVDKLNIKLMY